MIWTDFIQTVIMLIGAAILMVVCKYIIFTEIGLPKSESSKQKLIAVPNVFENAII